MVGRMLSDDDMPQSEFDGYHERDQLTRGRERPNREVRYTLMDTQMGQRKGLMAEYRWPN